MRAFGQLAALGVPPGDLERSTAYYHGTPRETAAKEILSTRQIIPGVESSGNAARTLAKSGFMKPAAGKVYVTPSLYYALIYALGGAFVGQPMNDSFVKALGRYGYVFSVAGKDLVDIDPDEDSVGHLVWQQSRPLFRRGDIDWLLPFARRHLTANQLRRTLDGEATWQTASGKKLLKVMSDRQKLDLIRAGAHIAHDGPLPITAAWRVLRADSKKLAADGSNFFKIAERVL